MATRIQVRRGTAAEWNTSNTVLDVGEFGFNTTTYQLKIGNGSTSWNHLDYIPTADSLDTSLGSYIELSEKGDVSGVAELDASRNILAPAGIVFEGTTADAHETSLVVTDPTADRTITLPNSSGTVLLADNSGNVTVSGNLTVSGTTTTIDSTTINVVNSFIFEGTANDHETTLTIADPTADRTITLPDATGTVALASDLSAFATTSYVSNSVSSHNATSTNVHGIADTAALATTSYVGTAIQNLASTSFVGNSVSSHNATTTNVHGIADTASLATTSYVGTEIANLATTSFVGNSVSSHAALTATHGVAGAIVGTSDAQTLTNKTFALGSNTVSGTIAQFNTAVTDADFATLAGAETLTNKTITSPLGLVKGDVGLGNVDNTSDTSKPVSTATQTALDLKANLAGATFTGALSGTDLTLSGNLTVNGTTTNINSTNLVVEDKNIVLGDTATPSDITADGGGITLKGTTDKTFTWSDSTDSWSSSEHVSIASGKSYKINGTNITAAVPALTWGDVKNGKSGLVIS